MQLPRGILVPRLGYSPKKHAFSGVGEDGVVQL